MPPLLSTRHGHGLTLTCVIISSFHPLAPSGWTPDCCVPIALPVPSVAPDTGSICTGGSVHWGGGWLGRARRTFAFPHCLHPSCVVFLLLGLPLLPFSCGPFTTFLLIQLKSHFLVIKWHPDSQLPNETPLKIQANNIRITETKQSRQPPACKEVDSVSDCHSQLT